jgi:hypothetical protein
MTFKRFIGLPKDIYFLLILLFVILFFFRSYVFFEGDFVQDYLLPRDSMAHAYKVETVKSMLTTDNSLVDWDDDWYCGYHPFRFYSPLGYVPYVILNIVMNDLGAALRTGILLGFVLGAIGMYFLVLTLMQDKLEHLYVRIAATGSALFFSLHPHIVEFVALTGELPALYAIAMMPISLIFLFKFLRSGSLKMCVVYAITTAITFLAHAHFGVVVAFCGLLFFVISLKKGQIRQRISVYFLYIILLAGLVAFWILPYFTEGPLLGNLTLYSWQSELTSINYLDLVLAPQNYYSGVRYLGIVSIIIMFFAFLDRKKWRDLAGLFSGFIVIWLLAIGPKTPVYALLPFNELFFPERALPLLVLITGCIMAFSLVAIMKYIDNIMSSKKFNHNMRSGIPYVLAFLLIFLTLSDTSVRYAGLATLYPGDSDFVLLGDKINSLNNEQEGGRTMFLGPEYTLYSYSPILSGRPLVDGYYGQGSKLSYDFLYLSTFSINNNYTEFFLGRFVDYDIKYVIVDATYDLMLNNLLRTEQFKLIDTIGGYKLLEFLGRKGFVIEDRPDVLVIGMNEYTLNLASGILKVFAQNFTVTDGQYTCIDDYTSNDLKGHDVVLIHSIKYHDKLAAEKLLSQYSKEGGFLVVDADFSTNSTANFMGGRSQIFYSKEPLKITYSEFDATFDLKLLELNGVFYEELDEPLLIVNGNKTIIGRKNGVMFVGGNLFYNSALNNEPAQISIIQQLISSGLKTDGGRKADYLVLKDQPDHKEYKVSLSAESMIRLSITTSPYWRVHVDGVPANIIDQAGFMRLIIEKGEHIITLHYADTVLKMISNAITVIALLLCVTIYIKGKPRIRAGNLF